jgi:hypothetical protein
MNDAIPKEPEFNYKFAPGDMVYLKADPNELWKDLPGYAEYVTKGLCNISYGKVYIVIRVCPILPMFNIPCPIDLEWYFKNCVPCVMFYGDDGHLSCAKEEDFLLYMP